MTIKDAKPGRYKPKCSRCERRFQLTVYPDANRPPLAEPLPPEPAASDSATKVSPGKEAPGRDAPGKDMPGKEAAGKNTSGSQATRVETPKPARPVAAAPEQTMAAATPPITGTHPGGTPSAAAARSSTAPRIDPAATLPDRAADATLAMPVSPAVPATGPSRSSFSADSADATLPAAAKTRSANEATIAASAPQITTRTGNEATQLATVVGANQESSGKAAGLPDRIGAYRILRELGRGAMGAVYLARQLSLDRNVALKTIQAQWASNPTFVARFTREAYAAAQLTHHNVIQIYDLGVDRATHYFSMEFVRGESLDDLIKRSGPLAPDLAVGYLLQAARGLQFAHAHGMIHRDIKPANMMLNEHGIVKIADLGLVKVGNSDADAEEGASQPVNANESLAAARADVTIANVAMGTPAYMAPEQTDNAAGVDHRADIYSLGCSFYVMLTGKPPFEGATALEVMTKHRVAPIVRPDALVKNIPKELADITLRMVAKQPDQRYQSVAELIRDLEQYVSGTATGKSGPTKEQAELVNQEAKRFHGAGIARLRGLVPIVFLAGMAALFVIFLLFSWSMAAATLALGVSAVGSAFVISGLTGRSPLMERLRACLFAASISDWLMWSGGFVVMVLIAWLLGWLLWLLAAVIVGVGMGAAYSFVIDRRLAAQRRESLERLEALLREWRVTGLEENALRRFIAANSGRQWEELFETLFGFEAVGIMRQELAQSGDGVHRARFRAWRDPVIRLLDRRLTAIREARDRRHLQKLEEQNLRSQGVDAAQARQQAGRLAEALVEDAAAARKPIPQATPTAVDPKVAAAEKRARVKRMLAEAKSGKTPVDRWGPLAPILAPLKLAFSGKVRFLLGCLLLSGFALWAKQTGLVSGEDLTAIAQGVSEQIQEGGAGELVKTAKLQTGESLRIPVIGPYFNSWYPGIAGILLIVMGLFRGWKMSLFALPAAALIVVGSVHLAALRVVLLVAGLVLGVVGLVFGRSGE